MKVVNINNKMQSLAIYTGYKGSNYCKKKSSTNKATFKPTWIIQNHFIVKMFFKLYFGSNIFSENT